MSNIPVEKDLYLILDIMASEVVAEGGVSAIRKFKHNMQKRLSVEGFKILEQVLSNFNEYLEE